MHAVCHQEVIPYLSWQSTSIKVRLNESLVQCLTMSMEEDSDTDFAAAMHWPAAACSAANQEGLAAPAVSAKQSQPREVLNVKSASNGTQKHAHA